MLRQASGELVVPTRGRDFYEITGHVARWVEQVKISNGLVVLHLAHTSASLLIQENADPEVRRDFERYFQKLVPDGDPIFRHTAEGEDDMPAHIRAALTAVQLTIPVQEGRLTLGTWQGIFLWEHRYEPHRRRVVLHAVGE